MAAQSTARAKSRTRPLASTTMAERYWAANLDHLRASQRVWATGRELRETDRRLVRAVELDEQCARLTCDLAQRSGAHWASTNLTQLVATLDGPVDPEVAERIRAAAVLRVILSDTFIADADALQPGGDLPAVGIYATKV
ncbi:hypothetical protein [Parafrankia sp. FMc2]|uniref:hypothetical protein n=1 Tax=Parafrankia sp. FMc2 TaxID=3233196 RepID=UPI0034D4BF67